MTYTHQGKILLNGLVEPGLVTENTEELIFRPEDDGRQIAEYLKGDFEWWYFDVHDLASGCFLKIVLHVGTDPLRTRVFPQLAVSVNTPERNRSLFYPFGFSEMQTETELCNIKVANKINIRTDPIVPTKYLIDIDIPLFRCSFFFRGTVEGWKPFGNKIIYQPGKKKGDFSWVVPIPRAQVEGDFFFENQKFTLYSAIGYHDHNYIRVDRKHPLYLDGLGKKWYWGKCYAGRFTMIFADVHTRTSRLQSLMVAENDWILHSSNGLSECFVKNMGFDETLKTNYPASLNIKSLDESFPFTAEFEFERILDRRDLLEGVNPLFKFLIKSFVARPVYHGILTKVRMEINNICIEGPGNFESMVFRDK